MGSGIGVRAHVISYVCRKGSKHCRFEFGLRIKISKRSGIFLLWGDVVGVILHSLRGMVIELNLGQCWATALDSLKCA